MQDSGREMLLEKLFDKLDTDLGEAQACFETLKKRVSGTTRSTQANELDNVLSDFDMAAAKQGIERIMKQLSA